MQKPLYQPIQLLARWLASLSTQVKGCPHPFHTAIAPSQALVFRSARSLKCVRTNFFARSRRTTSVYGDFGHKNQIGITKRIFFCDLRPERISIQN